MSSAGKPFVGMAPSSEKRPTSKFFGPASGMSVLRDNFSLTTWLCIGAAAQGLLFLVLGRTALLPAVGLLAYRTFIAYAMSLGFIHNTYMDDVIQKKYAAQFPDAEGNFSSKPADDEIVVLLIGTRCNHPLGLMAPEFSNIAGMFVQMAKDLDEHGEDFGFLGMTSWVNNSQRESKNELMMVGYFRTPEGLHNFAHSKYHTNAWDWWNKSHKTNPHISIYHENYHVPKGHWENIYVNSHASHLAASTFKTYDSEKGTEVWSSPIVDASKGLLRTSKGRMSRAKEEGDEKRYQFNA